jgi:glycosyltransferase involved in cell wall biosynthesis
MIQKAISPLVSILMPAYNSESYISQSIQSVLQQTYIHRELIIIDDWSTDSTASIIKTYMHIDKRIMLIQNESNLSLCHALNKWLSSAQGTYIARIDSDDIWYSDKLYLQIEWMIAHPDYGLTWTSFEYIDKKWMITGRYIAINNDKEIKKCLLYTCPILQPTFIFKKILYEQYWWYDHDFLYAEDNEILLRYGKYTKFYNLPNILCQYRRHEYNISTLKHKQRSYKVLLLCIKYRSYYPSFLKAICIRLILYVLPLFISQKLHKIYLSLFRS